MFTVRFDDDTEERVPVVNARGEVLIKPGREKPLPVKYIKLFKDVPEQNLDFLMPGAHATLTNWDWALIVAPLLFGTLYSLTTLSADTWAKLYSFRFGEINSMERNTLLVFLTAFVFRLVRSVNKFG